MDVLENHILSLIDLVKKEVKEDTN